MSYSIAASHAKGKFAVDKIFGAAGEAKKAIVEFGQEKVVNATIGAILDEQEKLVCLATATKVLRNLPSEEICNYAPIPGLPDYLEAVQAVTFGEHRPDAYTSAVATAGGSGVIHHAIWNYTELGDTVLTSDWYWGPYKVLSEDALRKIDTYTLFDEKLNFNTQAFQAKVNQLLLKQNNLLVILNAPAHNPTGYSLTDGEWEQVVGVCKEAAKNKDKNIVLLVDIAYLDYAGEKNACRAFMAKFSALPKNVLVIMGFSMSKGYTMYGQRTGAMIGIASDKDVIKEFADINQFTSRATWSNINRGCMKMLATIYNDKILLTELETERDKYYKLIRGRADIFMQEAKASKLAMLPYVNGFFLSIPAQDPEAVCKHLHADLIFAVPLAKGIRIAICAIPTVKVGGMAAKVAKAMAACQA